MAGEPRRFRVPYEWILGAMFVASFYFSSWMECRIARASWLLVVGPLAGRALGVRRKPDARPARFGVPLLVGVISWLYCAGAFLVIENRHSLGKEALRAAYAVMQVAWAPLTVASLGSLAAAALRPGRYRELSVFTNALFLLTIAWATDAAGSPRS